MNKNLSVLLIDFYKAVHDKMLPDNITKSVSYFTPRYSRVDMWKNVVHFGLQGFIKTYLIDHFNDNFFNIDKIDVIKTYSRVLDNALGVGLYNNDKISELHDLGYLPIEIMSLPEGTSVPMQVPMFGITNTHDNFAWLPQALESLISAEMWHPMISATVGKTYREVVNKYYALTVDDSFPKSKALSDMSFRGQESMESAIKSSSGWAMSFSNSATVPAIFYLEDNYNANSDNETIINGMPSTEHSIMCSNYAVDGNEITFMRKMLTEIYPSGNFSMVMDSYDYWNVIANILPELKSEILSRNGCLYCRGDSGDVVEVVTKTVFELWNIFGGEINSKGYKVLDKHIRVVYGDSVTIERCKTIYDILMNNGFACNNVSLGVGSFSMQCVEEDGILKPFTRDTFSSCIKATYCEINHFPTPIFKNPKDGGFKKSQKGCCVVSLQNGVLNYTDGWSFDKAHREENNLLQTVFKDGNFITETSLSKIRNILNRGGF